MINVNGVTGESKLTFLMPTYNDEKYIEESIKSIVHQTFTNWELLIMDKSSDKTINIINSYVSKYPNKIKYYKQEDTGQLNALLGLIPHISGNYIMLIHSDDFLVNENIIKIIMKEIEKTGADALYSDLILVNKDGIQIGRNKSFFSIKRLIVSGGSNCIPDHFFIKKEIFLKHVVPNYLVRNIPYYFRIKNGEFDFPKLKYSSNSWYSYRVYEENLALSDIGLFIQINGQIRLLKDFFLQKFIISPYKLSFNKFFNYMINISYQKMTNLTEKILQIKKSTLIRALNQFRNALLIKKKNISNQDIKGKEISVLYINNVISSVEDFLKWKKSKNNKKKLEIYEDSLQNIPSFEGKDVRFFYSEYLNSKRNGVINEIFLKKYDIILCENEKTKQKIEKFMDFLNYLTPFIIK